MKRKINIAFLIVFLAMLLVPLALTNTEEGAVSDVDGRTLIAKPVFGADGYQAGMEAWLRDRLGLRDQIVVTHAVINDKIVGELINPYCRYGKEGYVFSKPHNNIQYGIFHRQFADMVADMQRYCESRGTKFYYVFSPEKESIYRKYLPSGINYDDRWVDSMIRYMKQKGVKCIDLREAFRKEDTKRDTFNKLYDTGHWNQNGTFVGIRELTKEMKKDIPGLAVLSEDEYFIKSDKTEKLYGSNQIVMDEVPSYILKDSIEDVTGDMVAELVRHESYKYLKIVKNDSKLARRISTMLIFGDEMYEQFAYTRAKESVGLTSFQNAINFDYYYNVFNPDVVVLETMEYVVNDYYFSESAMQSAERIPAILANYPTSNFEERKKALLENANEYDSSVKVGVSRGSAIDRVVLSKKLKNTKYAYLISDRRVIDLKENQGGIYETSLRSGELSNGEKVILFLQRVDGKREYAEVPVVTNIL